MVGVPLVAPTQGKSCYCAGGVNASRKGVIVVGTEEMVLAVVSGDVELLKKLVSEELDRRCVAIDDIIVRGYGEFIGKRAESNQAAVKAAVLELVRSPLADLERKLEALPIEPEVKPEEVPAVEEEVKAEGE